MFLNHFGLRDQPFGVTPDPHFLYFCQSHQEALASLFYGIQMQRGFMALIAKPGMGKTTMLFHLLEHFRNSARTAFLFQAPRDSREFLRFLIADLGIGEQDDDLVRMHHKLNETLIREVHARRNVIVVIDEAQNLEDPVLEAVRMLSNFEIPGTKLMQILLAGQPQLADKLASRNMVQLRQRISILSRLVPFTAAETANYIEHRLKAAGYRGKPLFTAEALALIHSRSEGIPRNVNNLCFHALTLAFANGQKIIDAPTLNEVVEDLNIETFCSSAVNQTTARVQSNPADTVDQAQVTARYDGEAHQWLGEEIIFGTQFISGRAKLRLNFSAEGNGHKVC